MLGTVINVGAILVGSAIGLIFRKNIPQKYIQITFQAIGLFTLFVGMAMAYKTSNYLILVLSIVLGGIVGTWLKIDHRIDSAAVKIKLKFDKSNTKFSEGLVSAFLLYCMGSMTIIGAIDEGLGNPPNLLLAKSLMDGVSSIALSAALGSGVIFSVIPLFLYQGALTLLGSMLSDRLTEHLINELTAVGGLILVGMGLNILEISKLKVVNMLPGLVFVLFLVWLL